MQQLKSKKIIAVDLQRMARSIAASYGDKGAIVLTVSEEGIRIGVQGLTDHEVQEALCVGIHYNMLNAEGRG